ncbi:MAG: GNAT family N-acetyltransferase [Pseudomonadota bacterium]
MSDSFQIRIVSSLEDIPAASWNALLEGRPLNPFVTHEFLYALEKSGSAIAETGWYGQHLLLESAEGTLLGALPCYLKNHSQGEYVFDYGWADAFMRAGGDYYPKLQCSVPFTPATGPRFLVPGTEDAPVRRKALIHGLRQFCEKIGVSSAHITFLEKDEWEQAADENFLQRTDQQFHWVNDAYETFDDFLGALSSRKRKNIKKERRIAQETPGLSIELLSGDQLTEAIWDRFFIFYEDTGERKWGTPYLTREFFSLIGESMGDRILLVLAKRNEDYVAGAINFIGDDCIYGRHWGCTENHPCLHFEICYYQAIEYAIKMKLPSVEAGAQGAHKLARGYMPVTTRSAHWITHPGLRNAVSDYLVHERQEVNKHNEVLKEHGPFKKEEPET